MAPNKMTKEEQDIRDKSVATEIKTGRCPFGMLKEGQNISTCILGFPGCSCADELVLNPFLKEEMKVVMQEKGKIHATS